MDKVHDSIRIYFLNRNQNRRVITLGRDDTVDVEGTIDYIGANLMFCIKQ